MSYLQNNAELNDMAQDEPLYIVEIRHKTDREYETRWVFDWADFIANYTHDRRSAKQYSHKQATHVAESIRGGLWASSLQIEVIPVVWSAEVKRPLKEALNHWTETLSTDLDALREIMSNPLRHAMPAKLPLDQPNTYHVHQGPQGLTVTVAIRGEVTQETISYIEARDTFDFNEYTFETVGQGAGVYSVFTFKS